MTKVRMLKTVKGSPNGIKVHRYEIGKVYELNDALLKCFIDAGVVELAGPKKEVELETQVVKEIEVKKTGKEIEIKKADKKNGK